MLNLFKDYLVPEIYMLTQHILKYWRKQLSWTLNRSNVACLLKCEIAECFQSDEAPVRSRKPAHGFAGLGVVGCAQLHGAVQIQLQGFRCEAKHLKAVAHGGTFSVAAELSGVVEEKGNRVVVRAPARTRGK